VKFDEIEDSRVDHLVVAARSVNENFYHQRVSISAGEEHPVISPTALGLNSGDSFFVSVAAVDNRDTNLCLLIPKYAATPAPAPFPRMPIT